MVMQGLTQMKTTKTAQEQKQPPAQEQEPKQPTAKEVTRRMIEAAKAKNGGKLGSGGEYDKRKFRRL